MTITPTAAARVPLLVASGRLYPRDVPRYRLARGFFARVLGCAWRIAVHSEEQRAAFLSIGADPGRTVVTFGTPLGPREGERSHGFAARLEQAVAALADEATSDWYSARRRAAAGETPSLSAPQAGVWRRAWAISARRKPRRAPTKPWPDLG